MHARGYHKLRSDGRDAAFVRVSIINYSSMCIISNLKIQYELMVDQEAENPSVDERLEEESQYGELRHIFVLTIPPKTPKINPHRTKKRHLLLAQIYEAPFKTDEADEHKVIWYKGKLGTGEVVDALTIQCVVGRIQDGNIWWIIDRSLENQFTYPEFVD